MNRENLTQNWQPDFAAALMDPQAPVPAGLKAWNGSSAGKRFAVYRNNMAVNLVDGLCKTFNVCQQIVGEEFFRAMAHVYVHKHPPQSRILAEYGRSFADFIAAFEPASDVPYLADVARLEQARVTAYHAADANSIALESWQQLAMDELQHLRVRVHPSAQVLASPYPFVSIWAAHQDNAGLEEIDLAEPEAALVIRPELDVMVTALPAGGGVFLGALGQGDTLGEAASIALSRDGEFDLTANLGVLMQSGFVTAFN